MGTISKSLALLNFFSKEHPEIGLTEFRKLSGQDKATVHRHLSELAEMGFLEQNSDTRAYRLGPAVLRLAAVREALFPTRKAVAPLIEAMSDTLGELVHVALLEGTTMSPVYHYDAIIHGTRVHLDPSEKLPLNATSSGISQLAFGQPELLENTLAQPLERWTDRTITTADRLIEQVEYARSSGIAHVNQGFETDVCSFAAPIFGIGEYSTGALAVAIPVSRHTSGLQKRIEQTLQAGAVAVTEELGGVFPDALARRWQNG